MPSVIRSLSEEGFRLAGEKTVSGVRGKATALIGWVPFHKLAAIYRNPLVRRVAVEKEISGTQFRASVRFTLRAPGGKQSGTFVSDYLRRLGETSGFVAGGVSMLPQSGAGAKFIAYEITGTLPVEKSGVIARSPFVAAVEFQDDLI
jgi:hypothetical protein